jgi:3-phosphoshikimate 1-carboxyvinyltransferase
MGPLVEALRSLGGDVYEMGEPDSLPLRIGGGAQGGAVDLPGHVSSQFLSGLLLAGPLFPDGVDIRLTSPLVSVPYVSMTRAVMAAFGVNVTATRVLAGSYRATDYQIEPDASAASYFFAAAAITGGRVTVEGLGTALLQGDLAFVDLLEQMGAEVTRGETSTTVTGTGELHGVEADLADLSDTAQTLAAVAVFADSPTTLTGIGFIRRKETDRLANTVRELVRCGIGATEDSDGFSIRPGAPKPATIETYDDHRMAMSFALLGLRASGIEIADPGCVAKTYPRFFDDLDQLRR